MNIKVVVGSYCKDKEVLHFTRWTMFGLGYEKHLAIYYPSTNTLEVCSGEAKLLPKILKALKKYITSFAYGSLTFGHESVKVLYWA